MHDVASTSTRRLYDVTDVETANQEYQYHIFISKVDIMKAHTTCEEKMGLRFSTRIAMKSLSKCLP